jgi:flagellar motor switch/type III secretory pathway protein FliN
MNLGWWVFAALDTTLPERRSPADFDDWIKFAGGRVDRQTRKSVLSSPFFCRTIMAEITQQIIGAVVTACQSGAEEAAAAIARAFNETVQIAPAQHGTLQSLSVSLGLDEPGLVVLLKSSRETAVLTIPAKLGIAPEWCAKPDASAASRLGTLAQELGMNLLPETWLAHDFHAAWVENLADALDRGGVPQNAATIPLAISREGTALGCLGLIWPVKNPDGVFASEPPKSPAGKEKIGRSTRKELPTLALTSSDLPPYTRSLLRIKVPIVVTLAEKRQKLSRIVELGPGSIIQFEKSCEEMLELGVANRPVAVGEAVKVGDKFGLRITSMALPEERFNSVQASK